MNKRSRGFEYEEMAAGYIKEQGAIILERNYRSRMGEIDIIAKDDDTVCFIEVKYRQDSAKGDPTEAVGIKKQFTICRVSDYYRMEKRLSEDMAYRYDVIAIKGKEICWYKNAFSYIMV
ncbi:MAG: YraN family protein [Lachnospiraceae bacterium]|nr:YraN family protein [Lachnospiraceae bacterium]